MSAAMVEAVTTLACASPANCFFQVSKPAAVLPHCRISTNAGLNSVTRNIANTAAKARAKNLARQAAAAL
jgi:hypothetical protein